MEHGVRVSVVKRRYLPVMVDLREREPSFSAASLS